MLFAVFVYIGDRVDHFYSRIVRRHVRIAAELHHVLADLGCYHNVLVLFLYFRNNFSLVTYGPDSFIGLLTSTLQGSTETTFYVLALYLGAARVTDGRHALAACLIGDLAGFAGAVAACHWFFG